MFKIVRVITVLHQKYEFLVALCVVIQFYYILMFELGMERAFLLGVFYLNIIEELVFSYCFLDHWLYQE